MHSKLREWSEEDSEAGRKFKMFIEDCLYEKGLKPGDAAARINISSERMYKYLNRNSAYNNLPAYLIPIWHRTIGPELLSYLAHESGAAVVNFPEKPLDLSDAIEAAARAMRDCAEAIATYSQAVEDGEVTARGAKQVAREVREAIRALLGLRITAERLQRGKSD